MKHIMEISVKSCSLVLIASMGSTILRRTVKGQFAPAASYKSYCE